MSEEFYCHKCNKCINEEDTFIQEKLETYTIMGTDEISLVVPVRCCEKCGSEILDEYLDDKTLKLFYDDYHKAHNMLNTEDLIKIRNFYYLNKSELSIISNIPTDYIKSVEFGSIQSKEVDDFYKHISIYENFVNLWDMTYSNLFGKKTKYKIENRLNSINNKWAIVNDEGKYLSNYNIFTEYLYKARLFDLEEAAIKFCKATFTNTDGLKIKKVENK